MLLITVVQRRLSWIGLLIAPLPWVLASSQGGGFKALRTNPVQSLLAPCLKCVGFTCNFWETGQWQWEYPLLFGESLGLLLPTLEMFLMSSTGVFVSLLLLG